MTRRDTILISAVINSLLLCILFFTAVKEETHVPKAIAHAHVELPPPPAKVAPTTPPVKMPITSQPTVAKEPNDPIDQVLNHYSEVLAKEVETLKAAKPLMPTTAPENTKSAKPQPASIIGERSFTVSKGDVLEKIAKAHNVSVEALMKANGMASSNLKIGQVLRIPNVDIKESKVVKPQPVVEITHKYYTVKSGDSPWTIAQKHNMQLDQLLQLNNMDAEKARKLRPGDKLRIE